MEVQGEIIEVQEEFVVELMIGRNEPMS